MQLVSCLRACQCGPCARACSLARPVWVSPCNLTDDHFCSKGIMTCAGIAKTQGLVLKCTQVHTQQRVAAKGFGQKRSRGGGGGCARRAAFHSTCCQLLQKGKASPLRRERGDARTTAGRGPSCCLVLGQQARDSWVSPTAAFSWGEIKRLGDVGTCWPQEPKQCLI